MNKWLNYHHLHYFKIIASEGSIAQASKVLLVGQSSLSTQLKQLEDTLGQKLFERKNKKLILTEAGRVALEYADEIFKKGEEFLQVFNEQSLTARTIYKIGVVAIAPKILACNIMQLAKKFSKSSVISMGEDTPENLLQRVITHDLDIALTNNLSAFESSDLIIKQVGSANICIYGSKKYKHLTKNFPQSLTGAEFILPTMHSKLRYELEHRFRELGIQYQLVAEVQDSSVKKTMGVEGIGLIFLPEYAADILVQEEKLFKIGEMQNIKEDYWLIAKKRKIKSPISEFLLKNFKI